MNHKKNLLRLLLLSIIFLGHHAVAQVTQATMQQIQALLKEKNSRTPTQQKIDSRLLQAVRENRNEKMTLGVNLEPANVDADALGIFKADIDAEITPAFLSKITSLGARIIYASPRYHTVRALINLKAVETIAGYSEVKFIEPAVKAMLVDAGMDKSEGKPLGTDHIAAIRAQLTAYLNSQHPLTGSVNSEGDATHRADDVRSTYGYLGQGIKIGVLSDSYNALGGAPADVTNGDLPGPGNPDGDITAVTVVQDYSGGEDEGRAMLQVIHDLAPKATLFFATAFASEASFASNILTLRNTYDCDIIVDDVFYYDEPVFQDGILAQAVNTVTTSGALYFSSAGNSGSLAKGTSGVFEGDFNDAGSLPFPFPGGAKTGTIHNFGTVSTPVNGDSITYTGSAYSLIWSDPWGASGNDYDLFYVSSTGTVKKSSTNIQSGTQNPYEVFGSGGEVYGDRFVVFKTTGAAVRAFHLNTNRGRMTVTTNGQTSGHASAVNAFCMAATPASTAFTSGYPTGPYPNPFNSSNQLELFSSDGPRRMFYNPNGSPITPGNVIFGTNGGTLLSKPDLTAADGVHTTLPGSTGLNPFYGTSCSAPHAGAIAALLLSGDPSLTPAKIRTILTSTALDIEGSGYDINSGYGIIQAFQAAGQVASVPCATPTSLTSSTITSTSVVLGWDAVSGAINYKLSYKEATASDWTVITVHHVPYTLSGLTANTKYKFKVQSTCSAGLRSPYSAIATFKTLHTGQIVYCETQGSTDYEYIDNVTMGALNNTSGNNGGYGDYTSLVKNLTAGSQVKISLTPGFTGTAYDEFWAVFIDYNHNGVFTDPGEQVMSKNGTALVSQKITIPADASNGNTRMRIIMHYGEERSETCGDFEDGEAEDYTVKITGGTFTDASVSDAQIASLNNLMVIPNPVKSSSANLVLQAIKTAPVNIKITDLSGRILRTETISSITAGKNTYPLHNINLLPGTYMIVATQSNAVIARTQFIVAK